MIIIVLLCVLPLVGGIAAEYLVCRLLKKWYWRWVPPVLTLLVAATVLCVRYFGWSAEHGGQTAPLETLVFIPILPAALTLAGLYLGYRLWRWRWNPRVIRDKKKK